MARWRISGAISFVVEKLHRTTQEGPLVVQPHDLEPPAPARQDIQPPVRIFAQHFIDHRRAAGIDDAFFVGQNHSEFHSLPNHFAHHFFITVLEYVQRQFGAGQKHHLKRK